MNNLMAALFERIAAVWVERIAGSKVTTIAGIMGIVATFVGQLTTYIPDPYRTYVSLAGVIVAGVAAILARDSASVPQANPAPVSGTQKLGAWALIALLLSGAMLTGCTGAQVAQDIVNWTPSLQSAVATVDTTAAILLPAEAPIFAAATVGFDAASDLVVAEAKAYLANPNATVLAQLQRAVVTLQQEVNASLLEAARIVNPASQQHALAAINGVGAIVNALLALVAQVPGNTVAGVVITGKVSLAETRILRDEARAAQIIAAHYSIRHDDAEAMVSQQEILLSHAGF